MSFLLNPRVLIALAVVLLLGFTHWKAYSHGKQIIRAEWTAATVQANLEARALEQQRQRRADEAGRLAAAREAGIRADAARARDLAGGMRGDIDSLRSRINSLSAANEAFTVTAALLERCTERRVAVAEDAARADAEARELREAWPVK